MARPGLPEPIEQYVVATILGLASSAIWWLVTRNWIAAGSTLLGVTTVAVILRRIIPFLTRFQQLETSEIADIYENQAAAEEEIRRLAEDARAVDILTIRGLGIIGLNDSVLRRQLFSGTANRRHVRVLLLDPDSRHTRLRAEEIGESWEAFTQGINLAVQRMRELKIVGLHDVEVYLYDRRP